ncbi:DUF2341 domain-containing protein [Mucilaginibacter pallidiroseus]|uniref:DUF2341 domain-containing protein n=1 Tax=Mucilaginibacter pallidiroseus TaxID=2599295 RepID=A0A563U7T0_9SPHI|nr:DUF2341 domain-containing protein [Mucilaginibacter pallidiroseus]TWR27374.1 DUF2341 domain-containing protein [Mucilaginibacter pallidiroseus]
MKTHLLKLLLFIVSLSFPAILFGQETFDGTNNPREWYYNNLESATAADPATYMPGAGSTRNASPATINLAASSSLNNSKSYSTSALSSVGYLRWNFFGTGASSVNLNSTNWEWEFDYKNTGSFSAADPNPSTVTNSWKYWLITSAYNGNSTLGTYVTQVGSNFYLRTKTGTNSNEYFDNATISMPLNGHTYQVRILRNTVGYFYVYLLDRSTGVTSTNGPYNVGTTYSVYSYSYLEASSGAADRFQWDNFNFYRPKLDFTPISGNGVSTSIYPGIVNAIPYGVNVSVRGDIYIGRLRFPTTTDAQSLFADNSGVLYKTTTLPLAINNATSLVSNIGLFNTGTSQFTVPTSEYYYSPGNTANGNTVNVINYFLVAQGRNPFYNGYPSSISFSVSNTGDDTYQSFYGTTGPYYGAQSTSSSTSTPTAASAPPTISYTTPQNLTVGNAVNITPSVTNSTTSYSISATLPAGLSFSTTNGSITGTPTVTSAATNYTVTATNAGGSATTVINIAVTGFTITAPASGTSYNIGTNFTFTVGSVPAGTQRVEYIVNGAFFGSSTTSPFSLAASTTTGGSYSVIARAYNATSGGTLLNTTPAITVNVYPPAPSTTGASRCGSGTVTLTANGTTPSGGNYNWYAASTGGTALQTGASNTYTPNVTATTTYYVSYVVSGVESTSRTAVTATVNPLPAATFTATSSVVVNTDATVTLTSTYSSSNTYAWDFNGGTPSTGNGQGPFTVRWSTAGTKTITLTVTTTATGCSTVATQTVTVTNAVPTTPIDINTTANTIPENSVAGTLTNVTAYAYDPNLTSNGTNLALNKPVTVTSLENGNQFPGSAAVDGNYTTGSRWSSAFSDPQSLTVDLGAVYDIGRVKITWQTALGKDYQIQVSTDGTVFNTLKGIVGNTTLENDHTMLSKADRSSLARYVRIYGTARGTGYGYSIIEFEVYRSGVDYSLSNNAGNRFTIDQGTGVITAGSVATDYETATSHSVTVVATTPSGTSSQTFNITVSDVNDNTPVITSTNTASVTEGTTAVKTITATDADGTSPNSTITTYAIAGGTNASLFTINATTGALAFVTAPVYSTSGSNSYVVNVTAKDGGTPALTSTAQALTVTVTRSTFDSYAYRMPITLQSQGIGMSGNLTNFPVLVSVQNNADLAVTAGVCTNKIQYPAGPNYDIAFVDAAGNELNYQIEKYDASTGTLLAWVRVPVLYSAANTSLYLYFGRAVAPTNHTTAFANATWSNVTSSPTTYQAVWHFNEVPSTTTSSVVDATGSGDNLIASKTTVVQNANSIIQNGVTLSGGTLSKSAATGLTALNTSFTMSSWVYYTAYPNFADNVMVLQDGGSYVQMAFRGTSNNSVSANVGGGGILVSSNLTPAANAWHHIVYSYNGTTNSIYVDGALANTSTTAPNTGTPNTIVFGSYAVGNGENFYGTVDEARLINTTLSADWVKAEYANQRAPLTFCVTGATNADATNVLTIPGGVIYTYNGSTYTPNVTGVSATPSFNGKESFILSGNTTLGGNYSAYAVTVNNGVTFNLNGQTLNVACNVINNGTISSTNDNSTLNFNGTTAGQTFTAGATSNIATTGKLTINNTYTASPSVTIKGGPFNITSLLTITSGNLIVDNASNGTLTLKSTATQTANVAAIPAAYSVTGNVSVERYFTGGSANSRGYRLLSSPVSVSAASKILPNLLYLKDNAYLTGTGGTTNGFDVAGNPTLYFYRENLVPSYLSFLTSNFRGVKTINTASSFTMDNESGNYTLPAGNGFLFFFRGNRASNSTTNTAAIANTATFVSSGYLNQGDVTVTHWYTGGNLQYNVITGNENVRGFNLVGNPYASSIDWDGTGITTSSSISSTIWVYNPQRKIYATYIKGSGGVGTNFNGGAANILPSGQGFLVRATSNSPVPSVKFTEAAKVANQVTSATLLMSTGGTTSTTQPLQYLRLELSKDSLNREDALIFFKSTSKDVYVNNEDAQYLRGNNTLTMSTLSSDKKDVAINSIPYPKTNTTVIPVNSNISVSGLYQINLTEAKNIPDLYEVYLIDAFKKDSLDILRNKTYNFNAVAGDSTTFGNKRFKLVIRQKASMALRLLDFSASKVSNGAQLDWTTENERDYTNFTVERSTDGGKTFDVIGGFASADKGNYFLIDKNPIIGLNQYRLKQDDVNGAISYSKIVNLMYSKTAGSSVSVNNVAVFPNPATTTINVGITEQANSPVYAIRITDGLGMVVRSVTTTQTTWQSNISGLLPGTYFVQVTNNTTKAIVGNGKFIKQ